MKLVIFALWFKCKDEKHQAEIDEAFRRNCAIKDAALIKVFENGHRHNFEDVFAEAIKQPAGTICCTCNADCHFDETLASVLQMDLMGKFLCITRHINGVLNLQPAGCQDAWIWRAECTPRNFETLEFGRYGVDGKLNYYLLSDGYTLENPCHKIHVHHLHAEGNFSSPSRFPNYPYPLGFVSPPNRRGVIRSWIEQTPGDQGTHLPTVRTRQGVDANGNLRIESW